MGLDGGTYYMRPQKWPMWYVNVYRDTQVTGKNGPPVKLVSSNLHASAKRTSILSPQKSGHVPTYA